MTVDQQRIHPRIRQLCREHVQDGRSAAHRHRHAGHSEAEIARYHRTVMDRYLSKMATYQRRCDHTFGAWQPAKSQEKGLGTHQHEERLCRVCLKMETRANDIAYSANDVSYVLDHEEMGSRQPQQLYRS